MNGSSILKKVLPIIVAIVLIVIITVTVSAVKTSGNKSANISDPDGTYVQIQETVSDKTYTYSLTRQELYDKLKYGIGLSTTITMINKDLLKESKNDEGTSFWDSVKDEDIVEAIDEACYGEDVDVTTLDATEKADLETKYLNTMFSGYGYQANSIYDDEIKEHYNLVLAKKAYAKYALDKEIADADSDDPYFSDDKIQEYYDANYDLSPKYWMILIPFSSSDLAKLTLQQIGVVMGTSNVWSKFTLETVKDDNNQPTGALKVVTGDALSTKEVIETIIKLNEIINKKTLVKGTATLVDKDGSKVYEFSADADYAVVDISTEAATVKTNIDALKASVEAETPDMTTFTPLYEIAKTSIVDLQSKTTDATVATLLEKLEALYKAMNGEADASDPTVVYTEIVKTVDLLKKETIIFNTEKEDSSLAFDYKSLSDYDSALPKQIDNYYEAYVPFVSANATGSTWYSTSSFAISSVNYFLLKIAFEETKELADVKDEIIAKLTEEALTDALIEEKMASLREEYNIVIYDKDIQANYMTAIKDYEAEYKKTSKKDKVNIAKVSKDGFEKSYTADDLFNYMEKTSGLATAVSELAYQRMLYNELFNKYKNFDTGKWLGDEGKELKENIIAQVENQRLYFLSGSYTSYGYDPSTMTWEEFLYQLNGVHDEYELADMMVYSEISSDYIAKVLSFVETEGEDLEITFKKSYADALTDTAWNLVLQRMNDIKDETFSVTGEHLLVSTYETLRDSVNSGTPVDPEKWTDTQKKLAKELIEKVQLYLEYAEGTYSTKLQAIVTAFNAAPYAIKDDLGEYAKIINTNGEVYEYILSCGDVEIDLSKYKSAGLYLKYENLGTFTNGKMTENFEAAAKAIWDKDMADGVTDRVTVYDEAIETEFGYHLYVNLGSAKTTTFASYVYDANGNPEKDENDEYKTVDALVPSLGDIRLYAMKTALDAVDTTDWSDEDKEVLQEKIDYYTELVTTEFSTAITTYYTTLTSELTGSYFSSVLLQKDVMKLLNASSAVFNSPTKYTVTDIAKIVQINYDSAYKDNLTHLESGDDAIYDITADFNK